ncbi:MAG: phosphatase PAP2 family protein [Rubrivivax sp.]
MNLADPTLLPAGAWLLLTRLGEAQILLPAVALALLALVRETQGRRLARWWLGLASVAVLLTTASKVAFIGWGLGWEALDCTGVSGHAMFAAAIYPLLLFALLPEWRVIAVGAGSVLALAVGFSRIAIGVHSTSEVVFGLLLGAAVCGVALWRAGAPRRGPSPWVPAALAAWFMLMPTLAPASQSHSLVTRLALTLAGHDQPFTREHGFVRYPATDPRLQPGEIAGLPSSH